MSPREAVQTTKAAPTLRVWRIGLTGGIGSGKSTVSALLAQRGAYLLDADAIAKSVTASQGAGIAAIRQAFGDDFIDADGAMDRASMRALVFSDPAAKRRLEQIVHPLVGQETERLASEALAQHAAQAAGSPGAPGAPDAPPPPACLVFDIPLLVESSHWRGRLDRVLVIDCEVETQIQRVMARNGFTRAAVEAVIASQAPRQARLAAADSVIFNDRISLDDLALQAGQVAEGFGL